MIRQLACALVLLSSTSAFGQITSITTAPTAAPTPLVPYGVPISLADAKKVIQAAEVEAQKQGWPVAIAVVDPSGFLIAFSRLDNTQLASIEVAIEKARTSSLFRRTTKELEDRLIPGGANVKLLRLPAMPIEGGVPIIVDGKLVGSIGVSGVQSNQDAQVANAGMQVMLSPK